MAVDYVVDDYPELVEFYSGYALIPFEENPEDWEFLKVSESAAGR